MHAPLTAPASSRIPRCNAHVSIFSLTFMTTQMREPTQRSINSDGSKCEGLLDSCRPCGRHAPLHRQLRWTKIVLPERRSSCGVNASDGFVCMGACLGVDHVAALAEPCTAACRSIPSRFCTCPGVQEELCCEIASSKGATQTTKVARNHTFVELHAHQTREHLTRLLLPQPPLLTRSLVLPSLAPQGLFVRSRHTASGISRGPIRTWKGFATMAESDSPKPLREGWVYKMTLSSNVVVKRRMHLLPGGVFVTFHDVEHAPEARKTWYLSPRCHVSPASESAISEPRRMLIRPQGAW